jgi:uncharacterized membrane protein YebE (DUF533 family)
MDSNIPEQQPEAASIPKKSGRLLRTALLVGGSALLGGIAFAIFNRKQIETIRQDRNDKQGEAIPVQADSDDDV